MIQGRGVLSSIIMCNNQGSAAWQMCEISAGVGKESPSIHNWYSREINQGPVNWPKGLGEGH